MRPGLEAAAASAVVLVVDDDAMILESIELMLASAGYRVI